MTTMISELYQALKAAGIDDAIAQAAAKSVIAIEDKEQLATKGDLLILKADLSALEASLTRTIWTAMLTLTAIFSAIVTALKFVK